jgi:predicted heme/steroid binding protein
MNEFTAEELAKYDGKNGQPAYVAYEGTVYDVSESSMWGDGEHEGMHFAGNDLTAEQADAPHDVYITDFPEVGKYVG